MSKVQPPPIYEPMVNDLGIATLAWILFFNQMFSGDTGTDWMPRFRELYGVGDPEIKGRYYKLSASLSYFRLTIMPGVETSSIAGQTYIDNFPLDIQADGACLAVSGLAGSNAGMIVGASKRIYPPGWSNVSVPVTIVGLVEAK